MRPSTPAATVLLLLVSLLVASGDDGVDCAAMRTKALRQWLAARGLKCDGCAEKADYVALCEQNRDAPLMEPPDEPAASGGPRVRTPGPKKDADINELLKSMKGMPGMENIKVFSPDDLAGLSGEDMAAEMGGGGGSSRRAGAKKRKSRAEAKAELVDFYNKYDLTDKLDGVDAALDKWKGREDKMMAAVRKKYSDAIEAHEAAGGDDKEEL
jgi:hypothetical protein